MFTFKFGSNNRALPATVAEPAVSVPASQQRSGNRPAVAGLENRTPAAVSCLFQAADDELHEEEEGLLKGRGPISSWLKKATPTNTCGTSSAPVAENDDNNNDDDNGSTLKSDESISEKESEIVEEVAEPTKKKLKVAGLVSLGRYAESNELTAKKPKYIGKLIHRSTQREMELEVIKESLLKKEQTQAETEVFVTGAYKKRLEERKAFEEKMIKQDIQDALNDPKKKKDLTSFHHYMLTRGLAARTHFGRVEDEEEEHA